MFNLFNKKIPRHDSPKTRKERSENRLVGLGVIYNSKLPMTIEENSVKIRNVKEVSSKIICLWEVVNIASKAQGSNRNESIDFLKNTELWNALSPLEKEFLTNKNQPKQRIIDMTWRTECLKVLYWSLNEIQSLGEPFEDGSLVNISEKVLKKYPSMDEFLYKTNLRSKKEILDESDFIYRLHWCSKQHRREEQKVPSNYNYSVIRERDFALWWLTDPSLKWDEITLDT